MNEESNNSNTITVKLPSILAKKLRDVKEAKATKKYIEERIHDIEKLVELATN